MITRRAWLPLAALVASTSLAFAQTPPPMAAPPPIGADQKMFMVTYIDVSPSKVEDAAKVIGNYAKAAAKSEGLSNGVALQRIGIANQFALIQSWSTYKLEQAHEAGSTYKNFRKAIEPLMIAPYDERPHIDLNSGAVGKAPANAIYVATHVDIIPTFKDKGVAAVKVLADKSRGTTGNARYDALTQYSRQNHMTLFEVWKTRGNQEAHSIAADTRNFRNTLSTMSGSLFDERLYRAVK